MSRTAAMLLLAVGRVGKSGRNPAPIHLRPEKQGLLALRPELGRRLSILMRRLSACDISTSALRRCRAALSFRARFDRAFRLPAGKTPPWERGCGNLRGVRSHGKNKAKTIAYEKSFETVACYLCNTRQQTRVPSPFRAVPLLPVHFASVIVSVRRRGASRGRPVLGGSLKSLAFMRVCPKARSD